MTADGLLCAGLFWDCMNQTRRLFLATIGAALLPKPKPITPLWPGPASAICTYSNQIGPPLSIESLQAALRELAKLCDEPIVLTLPVYDPSAWRAWNATK